MLTMTSRSSVRRVKTVSAASATTAMAPVKAWSSVNRLVSSMADRSAWIPSSVMVRSIRGGSAGPGNSRVCAPCMITRPSPYTASCGTRVATIDGMANPPAVSTTRMASVAPVGCPTSPEPPFPEAGALGSPEDDDEGAALPGAAHAASSRSRVMPGAVRFMAPWTPRRAGRFRAFAARMAGMHRRPRALGILVASLAVLGLPAAALAHGDEAPAPTLTSALLAWRFDPLALGLIGATCLVYLWAVRRVDAAHAHNRHPAWRTRLFLAGLAAIAVALVSP